MVRISLLFGGSSKKQGFCCKNGGKICGFGMKNRGDWTRNPEESIGRKGEVVAMSNGVLVESSGRGGAAGRRRMANGK